MFFNNYTQCPCCGKLIDDGALYHVKDTNIYSCVCFDCEESIPDSEIRDILERKLRD